mgnify:CR=1 FL=1
MIKFEGHICHVSYFAIDSQNDHVDVLLADGSVEPTFRFAVREIEIHPALVTLNDHWMNRKS